MGYGAIISALVQAGVAIYGEATKGDPNKPLKEEAKAINKAANQFILPFTNPGMWELNVPGMAAQSMQLGMNEAPTLDRFNMNQLQQMLDQAMPGWRSAMAQMTKTNADLLAGRVPQDVSDQITRSAAFSSLTGGMGGGGAGTAMAGKTITARDLGLTSLDLTQKGQSQALQQMSFARNYLMPQPVNPMSLVPLSDIMSAKEWEKTATYNANIQAFIARSNAAAASVGAPQQSMLGAMGSDIAGLISALGKKNPDTGKSGFGSIMDLFGGGGGGSGGGFGFGSYSGGGGATVGSFSGGTSDFGSTFGSGSLYA